ncbi:hypothetical protein [Thiolapillus sp.]
MKNSALSDKQIRELNEIPALEPGFKRQGKVGTFIDLWVVCEVLAKKYIMYQKKLSESPSKLDYTQLTFALNDYSVTYLEEKAKPTFQSGKGIRGSKTAR